ncbi:MAG: septum formation initiator family protein [Prevotella sp.]|jgi:cell division protein DivIC|nr:septum formation initiator family protein [Prevotella sp.]MCI1281209.1 septum formation initiator family protein [Prevotella sp.]
MRNRIGIIWSFLSHYKYLIVSVLGIAIVGFLDDNSFLRRIQYDLQLDDLKTEIQKYNDQNKADSKQLRELKRDPKAIEKIARERYFMKADNEDIYVLSDDEQPAENQEDETTE